MKTERRKRRLWLRIIGLLLLLPLLALAVDYYAYPYGAQIDAPAVDRGENGLWLRYTWYFGQHSPAEEEALGRQLTQHRIRYAYFHLRSITAQGELAYHYPGQAKRLLSSLHRTAPEVVPIAWVYVGNARGEGKVDLSRAAVRKKMVEEALRLVQEYGFEGVQWDYEICDDGDPDLLRLLQETKAALPPGKLLCAATPMWLPRPVRQWGWSDAYFTRVAAYCDQIEVMCYDSGFVLPRSYVWLIRQQPIHVTRAVTQGNPKCRVVLGLPTYGEGFRSHNPRAENLRMALRGVREGLADPEAALSAFAGIAPFAEYTTDAKDWHVYETLWQGIP